VSKRSRATGAAGALLIAATTVTGALASSHREAPTIAEDPSADNTDLYAFVSPDKPDTVTIIANYIPLEEPAGGPNFFPFDPDVRYEINIDNTGDGKADVKYQLRFKTSVGNKNSFLYNLGPISPAGDNWNAKQTYSLERIGGPGNRTWSNLKSVPANIGPRSTSNYAAIAAAGVNSVGGMNVFAGQRDDAFFVDLGSVFDLAGLRPFNNLHDIPLPAANGVDGVAGFNTNSIVLQVPISHLTKDKAMPTGPNDPDAVLGIWASASRQSIRVLRSDGGQSAFGPFQQVSRLGNPLINEVVIPLRDKDYWNAQPPSKDAQFEKYYLAPELAVRANALYDALDNASETGRADLSAILLTGLDLSGTPLGINLNRTGNTKADMLRLNTGIKPNGVAGSPCPMTPDKLGVLAGDVCGFPNGRRLLDDVTDIELRAVIEGYGPVVSSLTGLPNRSPNNLVGDGVDANIDMPFLGSFPYIGLPHQGYEHVHHNAL
jgi:hypothetical protein